MESNRQIVLGTLLSASIAFAVTGISLAATGHVVLGPTLVVAGVAALVAGLRMMFHRPKPLVVPPEVARAFAESGPFMGDPPRYDRPLRERR
jgi:hypothetical protein